MVKSDLLFHIIRHEEVSKVIMETATIIEKATLNGPLYMIAGTLMIQVQTILGFNR